MSTSSQKDEPSKASGGGSSERKTRKVKGRVFIRIELCKGCRFCVNFCPRHTLVMSRSMNAKGYNYPKIDKDNCTGCDLCGMMCPDFAIYGIRIKNNNP